MSSSSYELSVACGILATHCCICSRPLTDAESVEHGIGPVCSRNYLGRKINSSPSQIATALSLLEKAPANILAAAIERSRRPDGGRSIANLLIYWFSAKFGTDPKMVLSLTPAIRALGYEECADKLEKNLSVIKLVEATHGDKKVLEVHSPFNEMFIDSIKAVKGRVAVYGEGQGKKAGQKVFKCWAVPDTDDGRHGVWSALKASYPGRLGISPKGVFTIPALA